MEINIKSIKHQIKECDTHSLVWWVLLAIVLLSAVVRFGMLNFPLERDEGEYAYAGQLILQGIPPHKQLSSMKLPGIHIAYAGILALFGQTHVSIRFGLLMVNAATIILIFFLARRIIDPLAGLVAAGSFAVLSVGPTLQGVFANAEHFVILPAVGGLLLLLWALDKGRQWITFFFSGLLLGVGLSMKQHGAAFIACGGFYILIDQLRKHPVNWLYFILRITLFTLGAVVPYGFICMVFAFAGVFEKYWFWTFEYARIYTAQTPIDQAWIGFKYQAVRIVKAAPMIWSLAVVGMTALLWDERSRRQSIFVVVFAVFSFLAISPGFYFRPHYFILLLPVASLLSGIAISALANRLSDVQSSLRKYGFPILLAIVCITASIYQQKRFLFQMTPFEASRSVYGLNPFHESLEIARFIRAHTKEDDHIAVIGSEPQIYFYSGRRSATRHIYMYPLMEGHRFALDMQKEMLREIETAQPKFLIFINVSTSWLRRKGSHLLLFERLQEYQARHYSLVGLVEIYKEKSLYYWGPKVKWPPRSRYWISVVKRKE